MDFMFTEEQLELRKRVRKFAKEKLEPIAHIVDESADIPWNVVKMLADEGYLRMMVPIERLYRIARATRIYEGTSEIQKITIARSLLREES